MKKVLSVSPIDDSTQQIVLAPDLSTEQEKFIARLRREDTERNEQYKVSIHCSQVFYVQCLTL